LNYVNIYIHIPHGQGISFGFMQNKLIAKFLKILFKASLRKCEKNIRIMAKKMKGHQFNNIPPLPFF